MKRTIDIVKELHILNPWINRSIELFSRKAYLDEIQEVYPFEIAKPQRLDKRVRREIISAHQSRDTKKLINLLISQVKFPYEDPIWYLLKNIKGCLDNNPIQVNRIAESLYSMTAEETIIRLESPPKLNTQIGPMFNAWLRREFDFVPKEEFKSSKSRIVMLDASEPEAKKFVKEEFNQDIDKRPDIVVKAKRQYIIGEAKWIGQPGGNQEKQVQEVLNFCRRQRGHVKRVGIVDGFSWAVYNIKGNLKNNKEAVLIQESEYDILSALLLKDYLQQV